MTPKAKVLLVEPSALCKRTVREADKFNPRLEGCTIFAGDGRMLSYGVYPTYADAWRNAAEFLRRQENAKT